MPWVRVDDSFMDSEKMARVGPLGIALWLAGLAYCNRKLTDGLIPSLVARRLMPMTFWRRSDESTLVEMDLLTSESSAGEIHVTDVIEALLEAGLWQRHDDGYKVNNYHEFQPSKEQVLKERERGKERAQRFRNARVTPLLQARNDGPVPVSVDSKSTPLLAGASENGREPAKAASRQKQSLASDEFRAFWDAYKHRRRRGWGQALAVWKRYRGDLIAPQIMAALQRDKRSPKWDEYAPEPERWLKKTPWEHTEDNPDETVISTTEDRWS